MEAGTMEVYCLTFLNEYYPVGGAASARISYPCVLDAAEPVVIVSSDESPLLVDRMVKDLLNELAILRIAQIVDELRSEVDFHFVFENASPPSVPRMFTKLTFRLGFLNSAARI